MNAAYAARHNYDFMLARSALVPQASTGDGGGPGGRRSTAHDHAVTKLPRAKAKFIADALQSLPQGGWLLYVDSDLAVLRQDTSLEEILATHADAGTDVVVSLEFTEEAAGRAGEDDEPKALATNTGALLLRHSAWTLAMLEAWHGVGYTTAGGSWVSDEASLTEWGRAFLEATGKMPPDQQMFTHLQLSLPDFGAHAKLLPTTALNSRWPLWALDGFDDHSAAGAPPGSPGRPRLQFALHLFATTAWERRQVLGNLHARALCPRALGAGPATEALEALPPAALAPFLAADSLDALAKHAAEHPVHSFPNAELCAAVYTLAGGLGADEAAGRAHHPLYRASDRHQACLEPGMSSEVGRFLLQRKAVDTAAFAFATAAAVGARALAGHEAAAAGLGNGQGRLDEAAATALREQLPAWQEQAGSLDTFRREAGTFLALHPPAGLASLQAPQRPRRSNRGRKAQGN